MAIVMAFVVKNINSWTYRWNFFVIKVWSYSLVGSSHQHYLNFRVVVQYLWCWICYEVTIAKGIPARNLKLLLHRFRFPNHQL